MSFGFAHYYSLILSDYTYNGLNEDNFLTSALTGLLSGGQFQPTVTLQDEFVNKIKFNLSIFYKDIKDYNILFGAFIDNSYTKATVKDREKNIYICASILTESTEEIAATVLLNDNNLKKLLIDKF